MNARPASTATATPRATRWSAAWVEYFILFQIVCQLALLTDIGALRVPARMGAFAPSLALWAILPVRGAVHSAAGLARFAIVVLVLSLFHPATLPAPGVAQAALYLAILAPIFWVPRTIVDARSLRRVMLILWAFHTTSALFGVLQVTFPGRFQPNVSTVVTGGKALGESLKMTLANGQRVFRPMGLTDSPGGAGWSGTYAVLLGVGVFLTSKKSSIKSAAIAGMALGMFCLYLCQVRSLIVQVAISVAFMALLLLWRGRAQRFVVVAVVVGALAVGTLGLAVGVGGRSVSSRLDTLVSASPSDVYYKNRGIFLEKTLMEDVPAYPLGAGLGRWGMMPYYFANLAPGEGLYAEIQWTAWIYDGGLPLAVAYAGAIAVTMMFAMKLVKLRRDVGDLATWAMVILAYDLGAVALTFNYTYFQAQGGIEFWVLNAVLFAAAATTLLPLAARPPSARE